MSAAAAMWRFWQQRGFLSVGRSWLERLLSAGEHKTAVVAKAHLAAGGIAYWQRDYGAADQHYQEALAISRALDDRHGIADATYNLAFVFAEELAAESRTGRRGRIRSGCCETPWPNSRSWTIPLESQRPRGTLRSTWPGRATSTRPSRCSRRP